MAKILIADDSWVARLGMKKLLTSLGHEILEATNGNQALELMQQNPITFLFLDLLMPELDGFGVLEFIQGMENRPKVYVLSADFQEETKMRCEDLGVDGFLSKPPSRAEIELALGTVS
jgi:twitching motility two-component system response regulator PilH